MMTLSLLLKATTILVVTLAASRLAAGSRAAVRHVLLAAGFVMLLLLPAAARLAPALDVALPPAFESAVAPLDDSAIVDVIEATTAPAAATRVPAPVARDGWTVPPLSEAVTTFWIAGMVVGVLPVIVGFIRVRRLRRSSRAWEAGQRRVDAVQAECGSRRFVQVLLHDNLPGPMTCGAIRPVIILPTDACAWADGDLRRALVHELEHVRRLDWLTQCGARVVAAVYWWHPCVWILRRKFALEAERACDDAVLQQRSAVSMASEDMAYADQLVDLARRLSTRVADVHLAMASRGDLAARIVAVLDSRRPRGRAGRSAVCAAALMSAVCVAAISPLRLVAVPLGSDEPLAQASGAPVFEVVSIKPCPGDAPPVPASGGRQGGAAARTVSPDRITIPCVTAERLIAMAYVINGEPLLNNLPTSNVERASEWVKGLPGWARSEEFTVEAKADRPVQDTRLLQGSMLAAVLEKRFALQLHREVDTASMYALTVAKGGLKIQPEACSPLPSTPIEPDRTALQAQLRAVLDGATPTCGMFTMAGGSVPGSRRWILGGETLTKFAATLTGALDRYVVDRTQVAGQFNIRLEFMPDEHTRGRAGTPLPGTEPAPAGAEPNIFAALERQLGLRLEPITASRGVIVVDRIERPTPDSSPRPAQSPARYEAASVRPCTDIEDLQPGRARGSAGGTNASFSPGRFSVPCVTLEQLVYLAYASYGAREDERLANDYLGTASDSTKVRGGPEWAHSHRDKWAIEATAPGVTDRATLMGTMLRTLLEERFKVKVRRAEETVPMYALRVARGGLKLKPMNDGDCESNPQLPPSADAKPPCGYMARSGGAVHHWRFVGFRLSFLARQLAEAVRLHVIDETDIDSMFTITLHFGGDEPTASGGNADRAASADVPSIFTALEEQLGLKLERTTGSRGYLVIDRAERPRPDAGIPRSGRPLF
jgi:uncharacterized protein (TIGR03435 family)